MLSKKRTPIKGFERYSTNGVDVFKFGTKVRPRNGAYHLVKSGEVAVTLVLVDVALGKAKPVKAKAPKKAKEAK